MKRREEESFEENEESEIDGGSSYSFIYKKENENYLKNISKHLNLDFTFDNNFLNNNIDIEGEELLEENNNDNNEGINNKFINDFNLDSFNINDILKDRDFLNIFTLNSHDDNNFNIKNSLKKFLLNDFEDDRGNIKDETHSIETKIKKLAKKKYPK